MWLSLSSSLTKLWSVSKFSPPSCVCAVQGLVAGLGGRACVPASLVSVHICPPPFRRGGQEDMPRLDGVVWKRTFPDFSGDLCGHRRCNFCHGGLRDDSCTRHHPASRAIGSRAMASVVFRQSDVATEQAICLGTLHLHTNTHKHVGQTCVCGSSSQ